MPIPFPRHSLSTKLVWTAVAFLAVALGAIGFTLYESWKLEGGAAAINDLGSERMRAYRIAFLLSEDLREGSAARAALTAEMTQFEQVLRELKQGDPGRPLFLPRKPEIVGEVDAIAEEWRTQVRPLVGRIAAGSGDAGELRPRIERFVQRIDRLVFDIEQSNARDIALLRYLQFGLVALALVGTVALIYLMFLMVVLPVTRLHEGMQRMARGELETRLPIETRDEFGALAEGFNRMAGRLQELYDTLEERVTDKTRALAEKNRELAALYEVAALLGEPAPAEELCRSFIRRLMARFGAEGGAVRLIDARSRKIHLYVHEGLEAQFAESEHCIDMGECLCGEAAQRNAAVVQFLPAVQEPNVIYRCQKAGYRTVSVFAVRFQGQITGLFNLYFRRQHEITQQERQMLETLGRHLGVAIESQRLMARDRELAVFEERNLLAQELHDSIAQSLAFLNIQVQLLEDALRRGAAGEAGEVSAQIRIGVQECYDDVRELLVHFRTRLKQEDIELGIRSALERFEAQTGIGTSFAVSGSGVPLSPERQLQALHVLQEALSNVRKHAAGATRVDLRMRRGAAYEFEVCDNGGGFDPDGLRDRTGSHVGLSIMRERARRIGGELRIDSRPGSGCRVTLTLPAIQRQEAA